MIRDLSANRKFREKGILSNGMDERGVTFTIALHPPGMAPKKLLAPAIAFCQADEIRHAD